MHTDDAPFALFDDNLDGGGDLLLRGLVGHIVCRAADAVDDSFAAIEAARARGCWVALAASYELGHAFEPRLRERLSATGAPLLEAWVFEDARHLSAQQTSDWIAARLAGLDEHARCTGLASLAWSRTQAGHLAAIARIRDWIAAGDCYQVNLTLALTGTLLGDPLALYQCLRERQPVRHGAFVRHAGGHLLSRSPELFVERHGGRLRCRPMKGTAPADADPAKLAASDKDRAENLMIVDLIRNDLGRLAPPGGVRVERLFEIERYRSVTQMTSTITAEAGDTDLHTIFRALFPCGSITGAPKLRATEIIDALEHAPRGLYCGALGWIAPDGDFRFSVPIRTLVADADGDFRMGVGSGIVADSDPAGEWEECLLKARFVTDLQPTFGLIETLRCEPATESPYPLLERHLQRLVQSAACFGLPCDPQAVRAALFAHARPLAAGIHRVRLELRVEGALRITSAPLDPLPTTPASVVPAPGHVRSNDLLLRHKTTLRQRYEADLAQATALGHFDVLYCNERDELTEGARSTIFVDPGEGPLLTPPLDAGLLDGVLRRKLLDEGRAREAVLTRTDLLRARTLYAGNALRGLIPVQFTEAAHAPAHH